MRASRFFLGLATGLAAGAATALFSAPQSGQDLRTSVKSTSSEWKEYLNELKVKVNGLKESINHLTEEAKSQLPETVEGLKSSLENWTESTAPAKEHLQLEIMAIQNAIEELQNTLSKDKKDKDDDDKPKKEKVDDDTQTA
ncbi:YtxH domain-containing protein [Microbacterium sp. APC 3898]|uniref:YtxH domain-containing protein n=2 Tax=Planococcus TaxID=1372 RepID=A0ABT7ZPI1_9BACL|nr:MULTISPECIES: YtxH domain-containing protein [Terrabacteria group]MBD8016421.1 YtxH domain-containing protein [Planococcus wigleyi]MDN3428728.1 YtxH domain-containing protein [Planococcus sp. APC 4016]MDN3500151.1 YtxH domain-containing protein [Microbacterium sp. APC 3898]